GVRVVDFRMKKINLPDEISESIYRRMRAERESVARKHRSQGREKAEVIRAQAELEVATILAEADKTARVTRGEADAEAAKIYAEAYNKDPEFFSFLRSLRAYEKSFSSKSDILVLDPKSEFFQYMNQSKGSMEK
ncbi:protease modulator HflC, partial [Vibrio parahaemolyticus]|nr:protease modulator HflC [Vibrio parahaemolyticus]